MNDKARNTGAVALVTSGVAASFSLAACCAIPLLLAGAGLGAASWLAPIVSVSQPYSTVLTLFALAALAGSIAVAWWPRRVSPGSPCARPTSRWIVTGVAGIGLLLLLLSKIYG